MDEDGVERAPEPHRAHVALHVLALGVQRAGDVEHLVGEIDERQREARLEVHGVVAAAAAELEHLAHSDRAAASSAAASAASSAYSSGGEMSGHHAASSP